MREVPCEAKGRTLVTGHKRAEGLRVATFSHGSEQFLVVCQRLRHPLSLCRIDNVWMLGVLPIDPCYSPLDRHRYNQGSRSRRNTILEKYLVFLSGWSAATNPNLASLWRTAVGGKGLMGFWGQETDYTWRSRWMIADPVKPSGKG